VALKIVKILNWKIGIKLFKNGSTLSEADLRKSDKINKFCNDQIYLINEFISLLLQ